MTSLASASAEQALRCLDLTNLAETCSPQDIGQLARAARTPFGPVAAVCIWPQFVTQMSAILRDTPVRIATVINFPKGGDDIERAVDDSREALRDGAHEIDLVIPWRGLLSGQTKPSAEMISAVADSIPPGRILKAILETGELHDPRLIATAAEIAIDAGAHFLKTSTGKTAVSATPEAARTLATCIHASGKAVGLKISGGIRTLADAQVYMDIVAGILGAEKLEPRYFRIGASGLLAVLLSTLSEAAQES